jgi:hypothetical protein
VTRRGGWMRLLRWRLACSFAMRASAQCAMLRVQTSVEEAAGVVMCNVTHCPVDMRHCHIVISLSTIAHERIMLVAQVYMFGISAIQRYTQEHLRTCFCQFLSI